MRSVEVTVAVNVTGRPARDGWREEVTATCVAAASTRREELPCAERKLVEPA
jgi:hypothetical protein